VSPSPSELLPRLPLARSAVDRDEVRRLEPQLLERLAQDAQSRYIAIHRGRAALVPATHPRESGVRRAVRLAPPALLPEGIADAYLGRSVDPDALEAVGTSLVLRVLDPEGPVPEGGVFEGAEWHDLRAAAAELSDRDAGLMVSAVALAQWHTTSRFSPRTGSPTRVEKAGWARRDTVDGAELFPRTDPAVIVLVLDDEDRLLLGSNVMWGDNRYSLFAGFVEAGESLESTVVREVAEEAGVQVEAVRYWASQPWPYPCSLMCGFTARVAAGSSPEEARPDGEEIVQVRWFTREQLRESLGEITLPGRSSIARSMIEDWYGGPL